MPLILLSGVPEEVEEKISQLCDEVGMRFESYVDDSHLECALPELIEEREGDRG
jgi:hypothetical protein